MAGTSEIGSRHEGVAARTAASAGAAELPRADDFVASPSSWYLLGRSSEIKAAPRSFRLLERELVAWRRDDGREVVMDARCSHLGADLGLGARAGDGIRCPFHGWEYASDGRCVRIPGGAPIPARARQRILPVVERHKLVFFASAPEAPFPLPFFVDERPEELCAARPASFVADCAWYMVTAHACDLQHFATVHGRRLTTPLAVDSPSPFARRSCYTAEVLGNAWYDVLLRRFAGRTVAITITVWGGTLVLITGDFPSVRSRFLIATRPLAGGKTLCEIVVFERRDRGGWLAPLARPLSLWLRRLFTRGYLVREAGGLGRPSYNPVNLTEGDGDLKDFFRWAATLT